MIEDGDHDGEVRWSLVQPSGWRGLVETVARGVGRWIEARVRARAMSEVVTAITGSGARLEIVVVEDAGGHWTLTVDPPGALPALVPAVAEAREA
jgi:hypothetical protein